MQTLLRLTALLFLVVITFFMVFPLTTLVKTNMINSNPTFDSNISVLEYDPALVVTNIPKIYLVNNTPVLKPMPITNKDD